MWKLTISERTTVPLIKAEKPWEAFTLGYGTVLHIGKKWHLWYESMDQNYRDDADRYFCYATSDDGAHWDRPNLGLFSYDGETDNNILFFGPGFIGPGGLTGATVFLDEKAAAPERF